MGFIKYISYIFVMLICLGATVSYAAANNSKPTIALITTGGTIAQAYDPGTGGVKPALSGEDLIKSVPGIDKLANIKVIEFANIDSRLMSPQQWISLARLVQKTLGDPAIDGIVITHGTDTMEDTSYFLDLTINNKKPVIITGAMRDASAIDRDGPSNLIDAVRVATSPQTPVNIVLLVMNQHVLSARTAIKTSSTNIQSFEGGDSGYLAIIDDANIKWLSKPIGNLKFPLPNKLPRVDIIRVYPGADAAFIEKAIAEDAKGLIIVGYGAGSVNKEVAVGLEKAMKQGVIVVLESRAPRGNILPVYAGQGGALELRHQGAIMGNDLSPDKARILLMLALSQNDPKDKIIKLFES